MIVKGKIKTRQKPVIEPTTFKKSTPRIAQLLALAYLIERKVEACSVKDYADAAKRLGLTRARVTQVMNLLLISPEIQEMILVGEVRLSERQARAESFPIDPSGSLASVTIGSSMNCIDSTV